MDSYTQVAGKLVEKANRLQGVLEQTGQVFETLKELLHEFSAEVDEQLEGRLDRHVRIEYRDRGKFEAQLQVGGEVLIFMMQTHVFAAAGDYCGVVNIYNFLADSLKYNRPADEGYLIGRVLVNGQRSYFVEGRMAPEGVGQKFGEQKLDRGAIRELIASVVDYALDFDALVPPYEQVKVVALDDLGSKFEGTKLASGKLLGREF